MCLTKATTRIRSLITPLLSAWHCGPKVGFGSGRAGRGGGAEPSRNRLLAHNAKSGGGGVGGGGGGGGRGGELMHQSALYEGSTTFCLSIFPPSD